MKYLVIAVALAPLLITPADAKCKIVGHTSDGEPLCMTTSDGAGQPYTDDRRRDDMRRRQMQWREERASEERMQRRREFYQARQARQEGARHTSDMATGGTMHGDILVSPYVPGSQQDKGWQAERRRRGQCGNDRLCLNAN